MITNNTIHLTQGPKQLVRRVEAQLPAPRPWLQLAALYRNPIENIMAILGEIKWGFLANPYMAN